MHLFTATGVLTRFVLRVDRIGTAVWVVAIAVMAFYPALALQSVFPTAADRQARAAVMADPAATMMTGPGFGLDHYTPAAMNANEMLVWLIVAIAIMNILRVTKHLRGEEETGRAELVRAGVVGRFAHPTAGLAAAFGADLAITVLSTLGLVAVGFDASDSLLFAAGIGATGLVFASIAAVASQLVAHARAATGIGMAVLGAAFLANGIGNATVQHGNWLSWLSPIAWAQQTRSFVDARWWPLLISLAAVAALTAIAFLLAGRRDVGEGLLPARRGREHASPALSGPLGLELRLQRGLITAWAAAIVLTGLAMGSLVDSVGTMLKKNDGIRSELAQFAPNPQSAVDGFVAAMLLFIALLAVIFAVSSTLRLQREEYDGRIEPVVATAIGRYRWMGSGLIVSVVSAVVLFLFGAAGLAATTAASLHDIDQYGRVLRSAIVYPPALVFFAALAACLFGIRSRLGSLAWIVVVYAGVVGMLGGLLDLPDWARKFSPFEAIPQLPAENPDFVPLIVLSAAAVVLAGIGWVIFARRDLTSR